MNWDDTGFLLSKNRYNENSVISEIFPQDHGKVSGIIFGGTSGIGLSTVKMLSEKGASKIIAISRNPEKVSEIPDNVELVKLDVLDENGLKTFFDKQGEFDILVNSATGGARALGPFLNMDMEGYRNSFFNRYYSF